jgi:methyl-accepting chemotaxis protein
MTENNGGGNSIVKTGGEFNEWAGQLEALGKDLFALAGETEHEFLAVGEKLNDYFNRAMHISTMSSSVAASLAGEDVNASIRGFQALLDRITTYLEQGEVEFSRGTDVLQDVLRIIANLYTPITGFKKIVKILEILSVSTKIESAQLGQEGHDFVTIADDVEKLSVLIKSSFADILSRAGNLTTRVEQTLSRVSGLKERKNDKAAGVLQNVRSTLTGLQEKNRSSAVIAGRLTSEWESITASIGEVVSAMQFHDITRQQVEHVQEALDKVAANLKQASSDVSLDDDGIKTVAIQAKTVCELQKAQLADSSLKFMQAVEDIIRNLKGIEGGVVKMYRDVEQLTGAEGERASSFLAAIEADASSAIDFFGTMRDAINDVSEAMKTLTDTVSDMTKFVDDIEEIGTEIELIAVNARIKAAHTGAEGAPLGVIAEVIQKLSVEARMQKGAVADELKRIVSTVEGLSDPNVMHAEEQAAETENLLHELTDLLEKLRTVSATTVSLLGSIEKEGKMLATDIEASANKVTAQNRFRERVQKATAGITAVSENLKALAPDAKDAELDMLKNLAINYTMHSERSIHKSYEEGSAVTAASIPLIPDTADHFGQNVELF